MENLFGTIGTHEPSYLLADNVNTEAISISVEPGNGTIPAGAVMYRKTGVIYAPALAANIVETSNLVVLRDDVDTTTSATVAVAAAAYRRAKFLAGRVLMRDGAGSDSYSSITDAQDVVLRKQGITMSPMDDWSASQVIADNTVGG